MSRKMLRIAAIWPYRSCLPISVDSGRLRANLGGWNNRWRTFCKGFEQTTRDRQGIFGFQCRLSPILGGYWRCQMPASRRAEQDIGNGGELFWWQLYIKLQPLLAPLQRNDAGKPREPWNVSPKHICHWATPTNGADWALRKTDNMVRKELTDSILVSDTTALLHWEVEGNLHRTFTWLISKRFAFTLRITML